MTVIKNTHGGVFTYANGRTVFQNLQRFCKIKDELLTPHRNPDFRGNRKLPIDESRITVLRIKLNFT